MAAEFVYNDVDKAEADLKRLSLMFCNEDKPLYLVAVGGWAIRGKAEGIVEAVGINGSLYRLENS